MRTDRELLELAAKAAGWKKAAYQDMRGWGEVRYGFSEAMYIGDDESIGYWNPLHDDGDALRLAAALGLNLCCDGRGIEAKSVQGARRFAWACESEYGPTDHMAKLRRAIVRAAAEIGASMP